MKFTITFRPSSLVKNRLKDICEALQFAILDEIGVNSKDTFP